MDAELQHILHMSSSRLRRFPLPVSAAAAVAFEHLTGIGEQHGRRANASCGSIDAGSALTERTSSSGISQSQSRMALAAAASGMYEEQR